MSAAGLVARHRRTPLKGTLPLPYMATALAEAPHRILSFSKPLSIPSEPDGVPGKGLGAPMWKAGNAFPGTPPWGTPAMWWQSLGAQPSVPHAGAGGCSGEGRRQNREGEKVHGAHSNRTWKQVDIWAPPGARSLYILSHLSLPTTSSPTLLQRLRGG